MSRAEKEAVVTKLLEDLKVAEGVVVAGYQGLKAQDFDDLRSKLRAQDAQCRVVKNTLFRKALEAAGAPGLEAHLEGSTTVIFQRGDVPASSRILVSFAKDHDQLKIKAGLIKGQVLGARDIAELASLPPRQTLIGQLAGRLNSPFQLLLGALQANIQSLVCALEAVRAGREA